MIKVMGIETEEGFFYVTSERLAHKYFNNVRVLPGYANLKSVDGYSNTYYVVNQKPLKQVQRVNRGLYQPH